MVMFALGVEFHCVELCEVEVVLVIVLYVMLVDGLVALCVVHALCCVVCEYILYTDTRRIQDEEKHIPVLMIYVVT